MFPSVRGRSQKTARVRTNAAKCKSKRDCSPVNNHHCTITVPFNAGMTNDTHHLQNRLAYAFGQVQSQTGPPFITDVAELCADLIATIGGMEGVSVEEAA
jgi:hypothetical protein